MNGADFLTAYPAVTDAQPVILIVTAFDQATVTKLVGDKAHAILRKPFDIERLVDVVRDCAVAHDAATITARSAATTSVLRSADSFSSRPRCLPSSTASACLDRSRPRLPRLSDNSVSRQWSGCF
jgi:DNA-binding NtrC family response regulator